MKDRDCRIMALNRRNCEVCNIKNELDVIGMRSDEVFTPAEAESFILIIAVEIPICIILATKNRRKRRKVRI